MNSATTSLRLFHRRQAKSLLELNRRTVVVQQHAVGSGNRNGSLNSDQSSSFFSSSHRAVALTRPIPLALAGATSKAVPTWARNLNGIRWFHHTTASSSSEVAAEVPEAKWAAPETPVQIFFASQTGTAQLFAQDLAQALQEDEYKTVSMQPLQEFDTNELLLLQGEYPHAKPAPVYVILASTTGVGEPPDHARPFYKWLEQHQPLTAATNAHASGIRYAVFGLGNSKAHPNHYNTVAKTLDSRLQALGHEAVLPLHLGDDGDCIDDDYDQWSLKLRTALSSPGESSSNSHYESETKTDTTTSSGTNETPPTVDSSSSAPSSTNDKYPTLHLQEPSSVDTRIGSRATRGPLLDICPSFYMAGSRLFSVSDNRLLSHDPTSNGLCELQVQLPHGDNADNNKMKYETGDHFVLYPRNADCLVQAFLNFFGVSPDAVITGYKDEKNNESDALPSALPYPHPMGITVYETLSHCVDLESPPSPALARRLLNGHHQQQADKPKLDFKHDIAHPRRTVLELLLQSHQQQDNTKVPNMSLSDMLWQLPPLQPRYYSIASSAAVHPDAVSLTYRPVQYVTSRGILRHGVCTSYMRQLSAVKSTTDDDPSQQPSSVTAVIRSNPSFRLPADPATPIWMIAGGCGVAPIRAFLQERVHRAPMLPENNKYGPAWLFLGFRSPADQVYTDLVQQALAVGAITKSCLNFQEGCTTATVQDDANSEEQASVVGCGLVTEQVRRYGAAFWEHCQAGGMTYLCGGARTFGVAIENELHTIFQENGCLSEQEATAYLQELIREGRLCEDLAD
jgi:NADPH-ferrihemoprotein reductase